MISNSTKTTAYSTTTILLIEDDRDDQDFITEALLGIDRRLTIHIEQTGTKAIHFLEKLPTDQLPQLLILDYNLPELDGAEVLQLLTKNQRYHAIPKIVWSTSNAPLYKKRSMEWGAVHYMVKPSSVADIEHMARQMLALCRATA